MPNLRFFNYVHKHIATVWQFLCQTLIVNASVKIKKFWGYRVDRFDFWVNQEATFNSLRVLNRQNVLKADNRIFQ